MYYIFQYKYNTHIHAPLLYRLLPVPNSTFMSTDLTAASFPGSLR